MEAIAARLDAEAAATSDIEGHSHQHNPNCGHTAIHHDDHVDYLHDGQLHYQNGGQIENHVLPVNANNPDNCTPDHRCEGHDAKHVHGDGCGHEAVPLDRQTDADIQLE